jgi:sugar phosphate isomerase/epimerase
MDLSIVDWFGYNLSPQERMRCIKEAGFSGILLLWADYFDKDYKRFPEYARNAGLNIESAHAPYMNANALWEDTLSGQEACQEIISCVEDCAAFGIPTLVVHPENKKGTDTVGLPVDFAFGIKRFKKIVDAAERLNVNIAVENISRFDYLDYIFQNIKSKRLGFCFDSGHCNVFTPEYDLLGLYGDKLMALHLHDNTGSAMHRLPFDGTVDWPAAMKRISETGYSGAIAIEAMNWSYKELSANEFIHKAFERAKKLEGLL